MTRLALARLITVLLSWALLSTGCDADRALCEDHADCAAFCARLGLPTSGATCGDGNCTCTVPDTETVDTADADDIADTTTPDTVIPDDDTAETDAPDTADPTDTLDTVASVDTAEPEDTLDASDTADTSDAAPPGCPPDMVDRGTFCIDRYEAPNFEGAPPLVMVTLDEAQAWCSARQKRLCYDDEWTSTCQGEAATAYPYGDERQPGVCNDDETWRVYNQSLLNGWPFGLPVAQIDALSSLLAAARATGAEGTAAADHVESLYQADAAGQNPGCTNEHQVFDLIGNVEEWTLRRDGGTTDFHGNLKGRYWADTRTCQNDILGHADGFRFYELGFRCCRDVAAAD